MSVFPNCRMNHKTLIFVKLCTFQYISNHIRTFKTHLKYTFLLVFAKNQFVWEDVVRTPILVSIAMLALLLNNSSMSQFKFLISCSSLTQNQPILYHFVLLLRSFTFKVPHFQKNPQKIFQNFESRKNQKVLQRKFTKHQATRIICSSCLFKAHNT